MKKYFLIFVIIILGLLISGCHDKIIVQDPIILATGSAKLHDNRDIYIYLEMMEGSYFQDNGTESPYLTNYQGKYQIRVFCPETKKNLSTYPITFDGTVLVFPQSFSLIIQDYNSDGNPDFTLGQRMMGNQNYLYQFYSINADGFVETLLFDNQVFIPIASHDFSVSVPFTNQTLFVPFYDNQLGQEIEVVYRWNGQNFVSRK